MRHRCAAALAVLLLLGTACVTKPLWESEWSPTEQAVVAALGDSRENDAYFQGFVLAKVPDIPVRKSLRPCRAFGSDIRVEVGGIPIPGITIANIIGPQDVGHHEYDAGMIERRSDEPRALGSSERNGLVYTCRGGFIDTAHLRDYADWTLFLSAQIARRIYEGGTIELPDEGGSRRVIVRPVVRDLRDCVSLKTGCVLPAMMHAGVRIGGAPWQPAPWRWGYGWPYYRGYDTEGDTPLEIGK